MTAFVFGPAPFVAPRDRRRRIAVVALIWLVVALVFVTQNYLGVVMRHERPDWLFVAGLELEYWLTFFALSPFFAFMAERFPVGRERTVASLWAHALGGIAFAAVQPVLSDMLQYATVHALRAPGGAGDLRMSTMVARYPVLAIIALWKYVVIIGVYHVIDYHRRHREGQLRAAQLESQLTTAQLRALRSQLEPHFLFNSLNSAAALTIADPPRARELLAELGELLRESFDSSADVDVTLAREIDFIDRYLAVERVRFEERLNVRYEIPEDLEQAVVPSLILQPLVENAIHHALAPHASQLTLVVRAWVESELLSLEVEDDGPGLPSGWDFARDAGTGLRNVQTRMALAGGGSHGIQFRVPARGLCVRLTLPHRRVTMAAR